MKFQVKCDHLHLFCLGLIVLIVEIPFLCWSWMWEWLCIDYCTGTENKWYAELFGESSFSEFEMSCSVITNIKLAFSHCAICVVHRIMYLWFRLNYDWFTMLSKKKHMIRYFCLDFFCYVHIKLAFQTKRCITCFACPYCVINALFIYLQP